MTHRHNDAIIQVKFTDGITESWGYTDRVKKLHHYSFIIPVGKPLFNNKQIPTYKEFETNPLKPDYEMLLPYFLISRRSLENSGFCEMRLKVHELIDDLVIEGWVDPNYPDYVLQREFNDIKNARLNLYWEANHRMTIYKQKFKPEPGKMLLMHFNKIGHLKHKERPSLVESWIPNTLFAVINRNIEINRDITRASIIRMLLSGIGNSTYISGPKFPSILIWRAIFEKFKLKSILDLEPNFGEKMIAAAACNISYTPISWSNNLSMLNELVKSKTDTPITTIVGCTDTLSDNELQNRIDSTQTDTFIAIITKSQLSNFKPLELYEIRNEPAGTTKILNYVVYCKKT